MIGMLKKQPLFHLRFLQILERHIRLFNSWKMKNLVCVMLLL